jgi:hypothetical protein
VAGTPDETLTVADRNVIVYTIGSRRITRTDGGRWGRVGQPGYVSVTYDHAGDLPTASKLAIMSVVAMVYRRRGSEEMQSETVGSFYSYTKADAAESATNDPLWQAAVGASRRTLLV